MELLVKGKRPWWWTFKVKTYSELYGWKILIIVVPHWRYITRIKLLCLLKSIKSCKMIQFVWWLRRGFITDKCYCKKILKSLVSPFQEFIRIIIRILEYITKYSFKWRGSVSVNFGLKFEVRLVKVFWHFCKTLSVSSQYVIVKKMDWLGH